MCSACLSDLESGEALAKSFANLWSSMGLGVILGPLVAARVVSTTGQTHHAYTASALIALVQLVLETAFLQETLVPSKRKPFSGYVNPFSFTRLFSQQSNEGKQLSNLSVAAALQWCTKFD